MSRWSVLILSACSFAPPRVSIEGDGGSTTDSPAIPDAGFVRRLDIDDSRVSGGPHAEFPLLVKLGETWLRDRANGGDVVRPDGADLYFATEPGGTLLLDFEIEVYAPATGSLVAWVKFPSLETTSVLYLLYGDPGVSTSRENAAAVWSGGYELVMHMTANEDATNKTVTFDVATPALVGAQVDRGLQFNGATDRVIAGSVGAIDNIFAGGGTAEGWFFATGYGENGFGRLFDKGHIDGWSMAINNGNATNTLAFVHGGDGFGEWNGPSDAVPLNGWHHAAIVYDSNSSANDPVMYIDGLPLAGIDELQTPGGAMDSDAGFDLYIGNRQANDRTFAGVLDELRLSTVPRSADWMLTQFRNQSDPGTFLAVSDPL